MWVMWNQGYLHLGDEILCLGRCYERKQGVSKDQINKRSIIHRMLCGYSQVINNKVVNIDLPFSP